MNHYRFACWARVYLGAAPRVPPQGVRLGTGVRRAAARNRLGHMERNPVMHNLDVWQMVLNKEREIDLKRSQQESRIRQELDMSGARTNRWLGLGALGHAWQRLRATPRMRWRWPELPRRAVEPCVGAVAFAECPEG